MNAPEKAPKKKLRVALFSGNYNYVMDGPVRALNMLVAYLERQGHEVLVFAPTSRKPAFQHSGTLVSVPSVAFPGKRSEYRLGLGLRGGLKRRLKEFSPDIIHIAAPDYTGKSALGYAGKNNIPAVASFHTRFDTYPRYYKMSWLEKHLTNYMRRFYARCEHVYAPSHSMVDELRADEIGRDIRLWTRGVDGALFNPGKRDVGWRRANGIADSDVLVAFVGRLVLEKGIDIFADAFKRAQAKNSSLKALIVGDGPERQAFAELLPGAVFAGYLQGEDLARAYASSDMFFNPSITETFGNVTLEAMASGLPSIGAAAAGSKSLIEDGVTGFVADPCAKGFAEKISFLASDAELRRQLGATARQRSERYCWDAILAELVKHYYEAIENFALSEQKENASRASVRPHVA
ncbi:glycosyltransferase family 1 protein [Hyphococcus flavus]|uniref:Glycosyltransferase family 1 protein n=1 Tax=Hyphococcus flavus TaxID=1866326 RepID=A0AAE9ZLI1_9PROT|nr:glycosyltransferase family 1 protein [Hyphococcus flavus]WDI32880.1 glycosyltransferase family 1 protein [Hyphococcus flavus]